MPKPENFCETCRYFDDTGQIDTGGGKKIDMCDQGCGLCRLRPTGAAQERITSWDSTSFSIVQATDGCSDHLPIIPPEEELP